MNLWYLKLECGKNIIGEFVEETKKSIFLEFPIEVFIGTDGSTVTVPWGFIISTETVFEFKKKNLLISSKVNDEACRLYKQAFEMEKEETPEVIYH